jgi:wyosine [tRNA(Phe)-imidazoG37] synthetase (radical SAM superfamily)
MREQKRTAFKAKTLAAPLKEALNFAAINAQRKNHYKKYMAPSTRVYDEFERTVQEYLQLNYAGDDVYIRVERPNKKPQTKLWEWNLVELAHGLSGKEWIEEKLRTKLGMREEEIAEYLSRRVIITVQWNELTKEILTDGRD